MMILEKAEPNPLVLGHTNGYPLGSSYKQDSTMAVINPLRFTQQVRAEITKIVWPTRRETMITTVMVFVMAFVFALFFFGVDQLVQFVLNLVLAF